jgi:CRP/FNR family cyclic AMP-dependent transcriptional regulator
MIATLRRKRPAVFEPRAFLAGMTAGKTSREYRTGQGVFAQGDTADAVFYIQAGKVKVTVTSAQGKEVLIATLRRGDFFGEGSLAGQPLRMSTAGALQSSSIVRIAKKTMVRLLHRKPEFGELFIAYLLLRNVRIEEDLVDHLFNSSEKRLARAFLLLAQFGKASAPQTVIPRMTTDTLASMVGTTRARVSQFMSRFRKLGFIDYEGNGLRVHSGLLTVVLHD